MRTSLCIFVIVSTAFLGACGGGSDPSSFNGEDNSSDLLMGQFIDVAPVQGLSFRTPTVSGLTDAQGLFSYRLGEDVVFSLGDVQLPETQALPVLTTLDVFATADTLNRRIINFNRLMISLDSDAQLANGVQVSQQAVLAATGLQLDFSSATFANDVINLVSGSGGVLSELVDVPTATTAYLQSLDDNALGASGCTSDHPSVGKVSQFETFHHEVGGTLHVIDDCTLEIRNFRYDGLGPSVLFYAGRSRDYEDGAVFNFPFRLNGNDFRNARLRLRLPDGQSLDDFDSLSVWCFDFRVNFGDVYFGS